MRLLARVVVVPLCAMFAGIVLFFFGLVLPLFVAGCVVYKIPRAVREELKLRRELREIIDGD